ncbi:MAG TPA: RNA polymerase sigma-70 factor [Bacteroidales bacterium]|nr:RNA polymerase sigma-70 factor [Bacteroidales bacterium]
MNEDESEDLARNLRSGNEKTYVSLFRIYFSRLCNFASVYVSDHTAAQDIAQGVFMKLWESRHQLKDETSIPAYLITITRNSCLDYLKHQQIEFRYQKKILQQEEIELNYNALKRLDIDMVDYDEINNIVEQTIAQLPPQCQQVFRMSRYGNCTNAEIAERLGVTSKAVEANITRALKILRHELKDYLSILIILNIPLS